MERAAGLRLRSAPFSRAHVVTALNDVLPTHREPLTAQNLFLFIGAFARVERQTGNREVIVTWIRPPGDIVALLLRGVTISDEQRGKIRTMLIDECEEVFQTLPFMAPHERDGSPAFTKPTHISEQRANPIPGILGKVKFAASGVASVGPLLAKRAGEVVREQRRHLRDRRIVDLLAEALLVGGLSTHECGDVLINLGIDEADVIGALENRKAGF